MCAGACRSRAPAWGPVMDSGHVVHSLLRTIVVAAACVVSGCASAPRLTVPIDLVTITGPASSAAADEVSSCAPPITVQREELLVSPVDVEGVSRKIYELVSSRRTYPEWARLRGWQGTARVCVAVSGNGAILQARLARTSGNAFLDNEALQLVRSAPRISLERPLPVPFVLAIIPINYWLTDMPPHFQQLAAEVKWLLQTKGQYPLAAFASRPDGNLILGVMLRADGSIEHLELQQSSGSEVLDQAATQLLEQVAPFPTQPFSGGRPVRLLIPIAYRYDYTVR